MKVYDTRIPIHETADNLPSIHDLIDKLGEMLDQYNISYSLALPTGEEQEKTKKENGKDLCYYLFYQSEQNHEMTLVVSLFGCLYLKKSKQKTLEAIVKSFGHSAA